MKLRIGVDLDNTIVCYDGLFHALALEGGLVPRSIPASKSAIRDHLRAVGREHDWTALQGQAYGPQMYLAHPFPGVLDFFTRCEHLGVSVYIVSHRSRQPYSGPAFDLHRAGYAWLADQGFFADDRIALPRDHVFFEPTKQDKLRRIAELELTHFIDDLPEFLAEPGFPRGVERILFGPGASDGEVNGVEAPAGILRATSWNEIAFVLLPPPGGEGVIGAAAGARALRPRMLASPNASRLRGCRTAATTMKQAPPPARRTGDATLTQLKHIAHPRRARVAPERSAAQPRGLNEPTPLEYSICRMLERAGFAEAGELTPVTGGANNRAYRLKADERTLFVKQYFYDEADPRDRVGAEFAFARFAWSHGLRTLPQPIACDRTYRVGLYSYVHGRSLRSDEVTHARVEEAMRLFREVNRHRDTAAAQELADASEACFSIRDHVQCVDDRLKALAKLPQHDELSGAAGAFIDEQLMPACQQVAGDLALGATRLGIALDEPLPQLDRCLSPSDFGFHNAMLGVDGRLVFHDFEYAGWDDPAKTVCDFLCQPALPVPRHCFDMFVEGVAQALKLSPEHRDRFAMLLPLYRLKWCCIMLNDFLPAGSRRRQFAATPSPSQGAPGMGRGEGRAHEEAQAALPTSPRGGGEGRNDDNDNAARQQRQLDKARQYLSNHVTQEAA